MTAMSPLATPDTTAALGKLLAYCRAHDWAGYDPYDALNSAFLTSIPGADTKFVRLLVTQALKRSPVNIRRLVRIPETQNPKAIALFLSAFAIMARHGLLNDEALPEQMIDRLVALRSPNESRWCWGYSFPWQTRTIVVPRWAPNLVCTSFVANALVDAYDQFDDARCLALAVSAAEYIVETLYWQTGAAAGFSYPTPASRTQVHNANLLAAALLCRLYRRTLTRRFLGPALTVARCAIANQRSDGSWPYGEAANQQWIDNFHTGYNLCALHSIGRSLDTAEFASALRRGLAFYRRHFFTAEGAPRYFHDRTYPIDIHAAAQSLITLLALRDLEADNARLAETVLRWTMTNMWDERGFFYYRVTRWFTNQTSFMRWSQAWMLLALATMAEVTRRHSAGTPISDANVGVAAAC